MTGTRIDSGHAGANGRDALDPGSFDASNSMPMVARLAAELQAWNLYAQGLPKLPQPIAPTV